MKIKGKTFTEPRVVTVVIPRESGDLIFKARAVMDDEFETRFPRPVPPTIVKRDGTQFLDTKDKKYIDARQQWASMYSSWMTIESLKATEDLEWETVTSDPATWKNYIKELVDAGFSGLEISNLNDAVIAANGLSQERIDEATERFLAGQAVAPSK